ncbi:2-keto-4-pentenoate hydratase [Pseudokordiimonas caeni]|uniref:2-keto-4-pentenoate hydratase n=1 Tax=Pseudokordiimonas caeni TaxID=2997908 RepID=UPI0028110413|nr:fumarylacetoacetate hydrolase family protein [Pseudokordiimonas caeni]
MSRLDAIAERLDSAAAKASAMAQLSTGADAITLDEAYEIQARSIARRLSRGESLVGIKMGFTSRAKMVQMGVADLIWGRLTDAMMLEDGGEASMEDYVHPRIEPEIAFRLSRPLSGNVSLPEAISAVEAVAPAMELIDSRYRDFKFSLEDVVADNCSSSGFVIGAWSKPPADIANLGMVMRFDGRPVEIGSSAGILGNPWRSLVAAARLAGRYGFHLAPGHIVLAGAATAAQPLKAGLHVSLEAEGLGRVDLKVKGEAA